jgi:hypothetical protein
MRNAERGKDFKRDYRMQGRGVMIGEMTRRGIGRFAQLGGILLLATTAFAQYGGGALQAPCPVALRAHRATVMPKATGIGVGAAGVGAAYLLTHRVTKVTGCTVMADDGLHLTDEKSRRTLALLPGPSNINAGERVELKGKIRKNAAGDQSFLVKTVAKDFGACPTQANADALTQATLAAK